MKLLQRTYPLDADVEVWVDPLDPREIRGSWEWAQGKDFLEPQTSPQEYAARQHALLEALLRDATSLDLWLKGDALSAVVDGGIEPAMVYTREEDLLAPLIQRLPLPDREYFEGAVLRDEFHEHMQAFFSATSATAVSASVIEGPRSRRDPGDALVRRRYRVLIEVEGRITEIDPSEAREAWEGIGRWSQAVLTVEWDRWLEEQERLQTALLHDHDVLDRWLALEVVREVSDWGAEQFRIPLDNGDVLESLVPGLTEPHRTYYERAIERATFYECAAPVYGTLDAKVLALRVAGERIGPTGTDG